MLLWNVSSCFDELKMNCMEEEVDYYERLDRHRFGLPVDVFIDCTNFADLYQHPILIYFRNSYNENSWNKLPLTVEETPRLYTDADVNITKDDLRKIIVWVAQNRNANVLCQYGGRYEHGAISEHAYNLSITT